MKLSSSQSLAGILEPVFAIRTEGDLGIGDTEGVRQMIDWCHRHRLNILQTLPINEISDDNSPYNALSSAGDRTDHHRDVTAPHPGLCRRQPSRNWPGPRLLANLREGPVNYPAVKALKRKLLDAAFENFLQQHYIPRTERAVQFRSFIEENGAWLSDYSLFRVLMEENGGLPTWDRWAPEHRSPGTARAWLLSLPAKRSDEIIQKRLFFMYVQWLAFGQWQALKAYGTSRRSI